MNTDKEDIRINLDGELTMRCPACGGSALIWDDHRCQHCYPLGSGRIPIAECHRAQVLARHPELMGPEP